MEKTFDKTVTKFIRIKWLLTWVKYLPVYYRLLHMDQTLPLHTWVRDFPCSTHRPACTRQQH